jgi:hypothetical protein
MYLFIFHKYLHCISTNRLVGLWCFMKVSTIFQLYIGAQFYRCRKLGVPGENHRPVASHWQTTTAGHSFYIGPIDSFYNQANDTGSWEPLVMTCRLFYYVIKFCHSCHLKFYIRTKNLNFVEDHPMNIHVQFGFNHICSFWEEGIWTFSHRELEPNLAGMFLGWSSTKFLFFVPVGYSTWMPGPIICSDWLKFQRS